MRAYPTTPVINVRIIGIKKTDANIILSLTSFNLQAPIVKNKYIKNPQGATSSSVISKIFFPSRD